MPFLHLYDMRSIIECRVFFILLVVGMGTASCYAPVDLVPFEEPDVPWVHCILGPDSTQWLDLRYLSRAGAGEYRSIDDAEVRLSCHDTSAASVGFHPIGDFVPVGGGRWRIDTGVIEGWHYQLQIILPRGDTLTATTVAPYYIAVAECFQQVDTPAFFSYSLHGREIRVLSILTDGFTGETKNVLYDRIHYGFYYSNSSTKNTCWIYKTAYTPEGAVMEPELATDREDLVDAFNVTGRLFTSSRVPESLSHYPGVAGQPLHIRALRMPPAERVRDTITISGDFSGPHHGCIGEVIEDLRSVHKAEIFRDRLFGLPHDEDACRWLFDENVGHVHFLVVSDEYDHYLKEMSQYELLHDKGTDIVGIYQTTNLYTNVKGGTGVFGAAQEYVLNWTCGVWPE